ncbi:MAG: hypothetical protein MZW92_27220 [Comamonadaceae bacterium]|nr:hypothetical protein [Comamonadaceae bacterium]
MGGREVGGLANQLAAHLDLDYPAHRALVKDFWQSPTHCHTARPQGGRAVPTRCEAGRIKVLWIMATNPAVSLPDADAGAARAATLRARDRLRLRAPHRHHALRPRAAAGHRPGARRTAPSPTPSAASRASAAFLRRAGRGQARLVDRVRSGQAPRLRLRRSTTPNAAAIFREHAALSAVANDGTPRLRSLRPRRGERRRLRHARTGAMAGHAPPSRAAPTRLFGTGNFYTPSGRARFVAITPRATSARR